MASPPTYSVVETLHEGERTMLYRAVRSSDGALVILKVLGPSRPSARDVERLENEFNIGRRLRALPTVVHPIAIERYQGMVALVLEDRGGQPLGRSVHAPTDVGRFLRIAVRIAGALADIHGAGVVHKDIKPENILLDVEDRVTITDFELASLLPRVFAPAHDPRLIEGSLPYMSPEQTGRMNRTVDQRTDLYSLGVVFYQLLAGALPFTARDPVEWVHCHIARSPAWPPEIVAELPPTLASIVMKLLAKVPEDRYESALGLKHDLERCLAQWEAARRIEPFALAERDASAELRIPQKLYGRELEIAALQAAFDRVVTTGIPELVVVSGGAGIGKSALVSELYKPVVRERVTFLRGKFDVHKTSIPYVTLGEALEELVLEILAESDERISFYREAILAAVGLNGQLVVEVIPQVELIIGPQPKVPELPLSEAQRRFDMVFRRFVAVFTTKEHPLVLFLDDLQWADPKSLELLEHVVADPATRYLLTIGAYRDNEVSPVHPAVTTIEALRGAGVLVSDLVLAPLSAAHLERLVADTLHAGIEDAAPLSALVHGKTGGNPFFVVQFLIMLHQERLLEFDAHAGAWHWDVARIGEKGFTDNVVDLMVGRIQRLPPANQEILKLSACIGSVVEVRTLAVVSELSEPDVHCFLWESLRAGLVVRIDDRYKFAHDRVQQAAYAMIPEEQRPAIHLRIGRLMLARAPKEELEDAVFEIVNQLNLGASLVREREEREAVADLDLRAARKAKTSAAYAQALGFLAAGTALLDADSWGTRYDLTFRLHFERAQCAYMSGDLGEAERLLDLLIERARTKIEKAEVYRVRIDLHVTRSENGRAVECALECLRLFGIEMSPHPRWEHVLDAYAQVQEDLGGRRIEELVDLPPMTDPEMETAMGVLSVLFAPAYFTDPNLLYLHLCQMISLSLRYGNTEASAQGYAWFGVILGPVFHRYQDAYRFGKLAYDFVERNGITAYRAKACYSLELILFWVQPIDRAIEHVRAAFEAGVRTGDVTVTCYTCNHVVTDRLARGDHLDEVYRESERGLDYVERAKFRDVAAIIVSIQRFIQSMRGGTTILGSFDDASFDERAFEAELTEERMPTMVCWYYVLKLQARFLAERYEEALEAALRAKELVWASLSHPQLFDFHYYDALVRAALYADATPEQQKEWLGILRAHEAQLAEWAENCPSTFRDKHALLAAEIARVEGRDLDAMHGYEEAIREAKAGGFVHNEGISYEVAARYYRGHGFPVFADAYLREARASYAAWGAAGKVKDLDRRHPRLAERRRLWVGTTFAVPAEELDLLSVVNASQTISREIVLEKLVRRLIEVAIEHGGAERGLLIGVREGRLSIQAEARGGAAGVDVKILQSDAITPAVAPTAILHYCLRTKQRVILDDAARASRFSTDEYVARTKPRSALCLPILRRADVAWILYLENNLMPGAFTPDRLAVLELLAAQAAISLENAMLLSQERTDREAAEQAVRVRNEFISIASHELFTPMTSLMLSLQSLRRGLSLDPESASDGVRQRLRMAERQGERMTKLIRNLLDASRLELGRVHLELESFDLGILVHDVLSRCAEDVTLAQSRVSLHVTGTVVGRWDRSRIEQVVTNLLSNALKYGAGRPVEIEVRDRADLAQMLFRDQGIGIDPALQPRIFERFERAAAAPHYGGLGLGLYICRGIVAAHGGSIRVESWPGKGATFIVELPRAGPPSAPPPERQEPAP